MISVNVISTRGWVRTEQIILGFFIQSVLGIALFQPCSHAHWLVSHAYRCRAWEVRGLRHANPLVYDSWIFQHSVMDLLTLPANYE